MTSPTTTVVPRSSSPGVTGSLIGQKAIMAVTGAILFLFVVGHLLGNLKIFEGPEAFNAYADGLRTVGAPFFGRGWLLWIVRIVLLVAVIAHIWAAITTARASWHARPVAYRQLETIETTSVPHSTTSPDFAPGTGVPVRARRTVAASSSPRSSRSRSASSASSSSSVSGPASTRMISSVGAALMACLPVVSTDRNAAISRVQAPER